MNLVKTSFYTGISTAVTFISGFILVKVIAVKIGPAGIAQLGQYQNTTSLLTMAGTFSIGIGVVKYLAEFKDDRFKKQQIISTAVMTVIMSSLIIGLLTGLLSRQLSIQAFSDVRFWKVYLLFGCFLLLISLNIIFSSVLNGLKEIKKLTVVSICGALFGILFTYLGAEYFGVEGVLVAANFTALAVFLINLSAFRKISDISIVPSFKFFSKPVLLLLLSFTIMNVVISTLSPIVQLFIRDHIIKTISLTSAGYWQAITRISDYYLTFITTVLAVYYLPTLSGLTEKKDIKTEILKGYKIILPSVALLALIMFLCRSLIISVLFTDSFQPMKELFLFQLIGDFLKIGSWLLSYLMLAKAMIKTLIITELIFSTSLVIFTVYFTNLYGIIGTTYAFALNYLLYWITMIFVMRKIFL
jgi:PST family polysaccharide transporter